MLKELWSNFCKAQAEMKNPAFDSKNPAFNGSKYASLSSVQEAVIPVLNKYGIAVLQDLKKTETGVECFTMLVHESGETYISQPLEVPSRQFIKDKNTGEIKEKNDAHCIGSAITYARRYQLQSICGVVGDDDDDGNNISSKQNFPSTNYNKPTSQYKTKQNVSKTTDVKSSEINKSEHNNEAPVEKKLTEQEMSSLADKHVYLVERLNEATYLEELKQIFMHACKEIFPYKPSQEYDECYQTLTAVKDAKKKALAEWNFTVVGNLSERKEPSEGERQALGKFI